MQFKMPRNSLFTVLLHSPWWVSLAIVPPLVITRTQIDEMFELIHRCLDLTLGEVRRNGWAVT